MQRGASDTRRQPLLCGAASRAPVERLWCRKLPLLLLVFSPLTSDTMSERSEIKKVEVSEADGEPEGVDPGPAIASRGISIGNEGA